MPRVPPSPWRMGAALGASLLLHVLLAALATAPSGRPEAATPAAAVTARLMPQPLSTAGLATFTLPPQPAAAAVAAPPRAPVRRDRAPGPVAAGAAVDGPDTRLYAARELDRYPAPLDGLPDPPLPELRLWLSIDHLGRVIAVEPAVPAAAAIDPGWHEKLRGVRFLPGQKDDRAVRSRILLVLRP